MPKSDLIFSHGIIGLFAFIIYLLNYVLGAITFTPIGPPPPLRAKVMPVHVLLGVVAVLATFVAIFTGIVERAAFALTCKVVRGTKYADASHECQLINAILVLLLLNLITTVVFLMLPGHKSLGIQPSTSLSEGLMSKS